MDNQTFDLDQIRAVIKLASESDVAELTVESPTLKVTVKKAVGTAPATAQTPTVDASVSATAAPAGLPAGPSADHLIPVIAPMVGTFYRAPNPDAPPFVNEGDHIDPGQTVCVIEAMKLFNEIQADVGGRIVRVLVENATPVEYGQPLFLIDPTAVQ